MKRSPEDCMAEALALARDALLLTDPNPRVGCVIAAPDGTVLGRGHTQRVGGPHAEVMALRDAAARGHGVAGATAFVTLEPCSHHGRTPPCCDALVAAGIARVVASLADPNPLVAGRGFERLRAAGIAVEVGPGAAASRDLNPGFLSRMTHGRPWVRMKVAASLDGRTALPDGSSQWITAAPARADGHAWRARASAVLTGVGTVRDDNPRLDVRLVEAPRQPHLVIVDSTLATPPTARLFDVPGRRVWLYAARRDEARAAALEARGATVTCLPDAHGKVDLPALLRDLAAREVNELHVEAGHKLNGSLLREGLVDELLLYLAPKLLGDGPGLAHEPFAGGPLARLADATTLAFTAFDRVGDDLRIRARVAARDPDATPAPMP
ncbi:MAG TPA: bifunctional diaminohydroxyphosphoribosylaminopyrimidine deaminase/5-amino-6-(5-phosphoribosylamino)uracil reductase RibD [Variovorax sp.]|nr:bifunctional diaminohydroxyphosphoribosylaminopyrimidine deaminase/5-amino-6-(5-phosphoribosylamino)uracil reductase RibD [Variovorax sp.]